MSEPTGVWKYVRGLERYSLCDWPAHPCCVIFLGTCNLLCPTCHNHELAWNMERLPVMPKWAVKAHIAERAKMLHGITITGGEPTHVPHVGELLLELKQYGLPIKMDSNGMRPDLIADILDEGLVDVFAVDIKGPFAKYPELTGNAVDADTAQANLEAVFELAAANPEAFYFRTTEVPALTSGDMEVARGLVPRGVKWYNQKYVAPRRMHAVANHEERRAVGDVVN